MTNKQEINKMKRSEFESLPHRNWNEGIGLIDSIIILPQRKLHDSGYRCMDFVAVRDGKPLCLLSGCSDVIHIEGIGGFGHNWLKNGCPTLVPPRDWSIDCLRGSGLLRLSVRGKISVGIALSSFEIFSVEDKG